MSGIIVDIIILGIILIPTVQGFHNGLTKILYGFLATVVAVLLTLVIYKPVAAVVIDKTTIDEFFSTGIYNILNNQNFSDTELINPENTQMSKQLVILINKYLAEALNKSAENVFSYVSIKLSHIMVNLLTLIFLISIIRIILSFFKIIIDTIANLPIIKQVNIAGGMAIGFIKGFFIVYLIFAIFSVFSPMIEKTGILAMIQESKVGSTLYNNNLILNFISKQI